MPAVQYGIAPIRYRPGQRHVLRYGPQERPRRSETLFAKLYEGEDGAQAVRVATWVTDQLAASGSGVTGVRPRGYVAEDAVILYPQVVGTPVSGQLRRPVQELAEHLQQVGHAL